MVSRGSRRVAAAVAGVVLLGWAAVGHAQTTLGGVEGLSAGAVDQAPAGDAALARSLRKARLEQTFTVADFNRDGLPDVAGVDFLADALTVMLGEARGGFAPPTTLATGRGPRSVIAADVTHDGVLDLVVGEFLSGFVRVFAGRGDGQFAPIQALAFGPGVSALVAHDVDSDGRVDLAAANALSGTIGIVRMGAEAAGRWTRVARVRAPTLLLLQDVNRDGLPDLVTIDAEGRQAWMFAGEVAARSWDPYLVDASGIAELVDAALRPPVPLSGPRLTTVIGDGQARQGGVSAREPLVVEVRDLAGATSAGETVAFARLAGRAAVLGSEALGSAAASARVTDDRGLAWLDLLLPRLPDATVMVASLAPDQIAPFRIVSYLENDEIAGLIAAALSEEILDPRALRAHRTSLRDAVRQLERGDALAALRDLVASVDHLERASSASTPARTPSAANLTRRFLHQILLMGSHPSHDVPDDEPIACDVPLTRTIEVADEVDRFTLAGVAGERVHVTIATEVVTTGSFGVWWRLLASDGSGVAGCNTFSPAERDCTLPATAAGYAIEVQDLGFDGTGTYSLLIQRLTAGQRCGTAITCDVPATTTISARVDTDLHEFAGVAGERVHVAIATEVVTTGSFGVWWRLLASDGSGVAGCNTFSPAERDCTLPATEAGYAIEVEDLGFDGTGTYSLLIQRLTAGQRCGTAITCDVPATTTISARVDTDLHEFAGVAGERVHVAIATEVVTTGSFGVWWRLLASDGSGVAGCNTFSPAERDCTLPATAAGYAIEVQDLGFDGTGTYSLLIQRLTAGQRCGTAITCDVPATTTISARVDTDLHEFAGVAGERVHVTIATEVVTTGSFGVWWRLLASDGSGVAGCNTFAVAERDCTLPATEAGYAIEVQDLGFDGTGTYSLLIQRLTAGQRCGTAITCDVPATTTISARVDTDLHEFAGVAGERVHVTIATEVVTTGSFGVWWRLLASDGSGVAGCNTFFSAERDCTLPATEAGYAIEVQDFGFDGTGTYSLLIQRLTAGQRCGTAITCDVPATTTISARVDTDLHEFAGVAGERVHVTIATEVVTTGSFGVWWRLLASDGSGVAGCNTFSPAERDCTLPATAAGYAIEVQDLGFDGTGTYSLLIQRLTAGQRCGTAITCDVPATTTISARVDTDLHEFAGVAGERVHVTIATEVVTTGSFGVWWRLLASDGSGVAGCNTFSPAERDCTLPPPPVCAPSNGCSFEGERYAIEVQDLGFDGTGTYSLQVQRLTAPLRCGVTLFCDVGATTAISARADTDVFELNGHENELVHITISGASGGFNPLWRLLAPSGSGVAGCDTFSGTARDCTLPASGAYAIEVQDGGFNATGTYQLTTVSSLQVCPPPGGIGPGLMATGPDRDPMLLMLIGQQALPLGTGREMPMTFEGFTLDARIKDTLQAFEPDRLVRIFRRG